MKGVDGAGIFKGLQVLERTEIGIVRAIDYDWRMGIDCSYGADDLVVEIKQQLLYCSLMSRGDRAIPSIE